VEVEENVRSSQTIEERGEEDGGRERVRMSSRLKGKGIDKREALRTCFRGEGAFVVEQRLNPGEDKVDVARGVEPHALLVSVLPDHVESTPTSKTTRRSAFILGVLQQSGEGEGQSNGSREEGAWEGRSPWTDGHGRASLWGIVLRDDGIELVEVLVKVMN
jgi:hypothetical protein